MIALAALLAAVACTPGGEFEPRSCPARLPAIAALRIERRGVARWHETDAEPPCAAFQPTTVQPAADGSDLLRVLRTDRSVAGRLPG